MTQLKGLMLSPRGVGIAAISVATSQRMFFNNYFTERSEEGAITRKYRIYRRLGTDTKNLIVTFEDTL